MKIDVSFGIRVYPRPKLRGEYHEITLYYTNPFNGDSKEYIEYEQTEGENHMEFFEKMYKKISDVNWVRKVVQEDVSKKSTHLKEREDLRKLKENIGKMSYSIEVEIQ